MKLTQSEGKIILRNNDFTNAIKTLPLFGLGVYFVSLFIYRQVYVDNSPISLHIVGLFFGTAFSILGGLLLQIQFARVVVLDLRKRAISVKTYRFLRKKIHSYRFNEIEHFEASACGQEACLDLRLKNSETVEIAPKTKSKLAEVKYIVEVLNTELRKMIV